MTEPKSVSTESNGRLKAGPAPELIQSANQLEAACTPILYHGLSLADLAHGIMLMEAGIIPRPAARTLLSALMTAHQIPADRFAFDPAVGDSYKNRERYIMQLAPDAGGWLRTGRARREATNIAYQLAIRGRVLALTGALADLAAALVDQSELHAGTIMSDYTYLQHAQPTTFAHYLLSFVFPMTRDFDRLRACFGRINLSPGGIGSVNGSRLPLDRRRLAELLGFAGVMTHTRDAMWQADMPIEIMSGVVASVVNIDRLAEDLQIWVTQEFGLMDLAEEYCRESVIMPQKKNPYSLAFVRGVAGVLIGQMTAMANVGRTLSGQPDSRIFAYGDVPKALDLALQTTQLMTGVVRTLSVNTAKMAESVESGYAQATDLAELIMLEAQLPYLTAHRLVGEVVSVAAQQGIPAVRITSGMIDAAAQRILGRSLRLPDDVLACALSPKAIVETRVGPGCASPESVRKMIAAARASIAETRRWITETGDGLAAAEANLLTIAGDVIAE